MCAAAYTRIVLLLAPCTGLTHFHGEILLPSSVHSPISMYKKLSWFIGTGMGIILNTLNVLLCNRVQISHNLDALYKYTGCNRRNGPDFGRVFLMLNYTVNSQTHISKVKRFRR